MRDTYNGAMHLLILYMIEPCPIPYVLLCDVMSFVFYFCVFFFVLYCETKDWLHCWYKMEKLGDINMLILHTLMNCFYATPNVLWMLLN